MLLCGTTFAADYDVSVTRKGSNLYKVDGKEMYVHTRYCYEYVYSEDSMLRMSGSSGKIIFLDEGESCDVKAVFGASDASPGKYDVTVSREDDDWYEVFGTDTFIKTSLCLNLALGESAILKLNAGGFGTLFFIDSDDQCSVDGIYSKLRL
ncbi:hypothetical protein N787_03355 [Arenimonas metalli CF5-1]|uniref:Uncharacterized protein n=2 Tax=Arenimonas TaxID=490567 RepID=A0A091AU26_9GAMM|nr:hypothetical protein N787_03355 [Arenimonas metalli CF5-1]